MPGKHLHKTGTPYQVGPLYLFKRGKQYHIRGNYAGETIRVSTKTDDLRRAKLALDGLMHELESGWRETEREADVSWKSVAKAVCARHRVHSRARGIPFQLEASDVYALLRETGFRCAVSGIELSRRIPAGTPDPWGASIDRLECRHGYTKENVRIVCLAANLAMNRWGYDALLRLSRAVTYNASHPQPEQKLAQNPSHKNGPKTQDADIIEIFGVFDESAKPSLGKGVPP